MPLDRRFNWSGSFFCLLLFVLENLGAAAQGLNHLQDVNPFIGTTTCAVPTRWGSDRGTYPGAVVPSGFIQLSPETRIDGSRGYHFEDSVIYQFSCADHFSGYPEGSAGRIFLMPVRLAGNDLTIRSPRPYLHKMKRQVLAIIVLF